jgi:hypothetical protein
MLVSAFVPGTVARLGGIINYLSYLTNWLSTWLVVRGLSIPGPGVLFLFCCAMDFFICSPKRKQKKRKVYANLE